MRFAVIELKGHSLSNNEEHNQAGALKECSMRNRLARVGKKDSNMPYNGSYHKGHKGQATHCKSRITWKLADDDILSWDRSPSSGLYKDNTKLQACLEEIRNNDNVWCCAEFIILHKEQKKGTTISAHNKVKA